MPVESAPRARGRPRDRPPRKRSPAIPAARESAVEQREGRRADPARDDRDAAPSPRRPSSEKALPSGPRSRTDDPGRQPLERRRARADRLDEELDLARVRIRRPPPSRRGADTAGCAPAPRASRTARARSPRRELGRGERRRRRGTERKCGCGGGRRGDRTSLGRVYVRRVADHADDDEAHLRSGPSAPFLAPRRARAVSLRAPLATDRSVDVVERPRVASAAVAPAQRPVVRVVFALDLESAIACSWPPPLSRLPDRETPSVRAGRMPTSKTLKTGDLSPERSTGSLSRLRPTVSPARGRSRRPLVS